MKKKVKNIAILLSIAIMLLAIGLGGYSYAKYITKVEMDGGVDIAKWSFKVNDGSNETATLNLKSTIDEGKLAKGKIAPGTGGQFVIKIDATGTEVGLDYTVKFENEKNKPTNLIYTYNGSKYLSLKALESSLAGEINANATEKIKELTIGWEWPYEKGVGESLSTTDEIDTQEGNNGLDYIFDVVVTGTQKTM